MTNRTFDDMTGDWFRLQRSYWENLGNVGLKASAPQDNAGTAHSEKAPDFGVSHMQNFFGTLMEQARMFSSLGSSFGQMAGSTNPLSWQDMMKESISRSMDGAQGPLAGPGWLTELWSQPLENWKRMTSPPQGLACALKPFTMPFTAESAGIPVRSEQLMGLLSVPGFGPMRESHDEHQSLARAWIELQKAQHAYHELFAGLPSQVCEEIGQRLDTLASEGKVVDSLRGFYDLVVDAAEVRYAVLTNSEAHSERYGHAVNALMSFRGQLLKLADQFQGALNLPTRRELDELHREARILSRQNRSLHAEVAEIRSLLAAMDRGNSKLGDAKRTSTLEETPLAARPPARARRKNISRETKR